MSRQPYPHSESGLCCTVRDVQCICQPGCCCNCRDCPCPKPERQL